MPLRKRPRHIPQLRIPQLNHLPLVLNRILSVLQRQRRKVNRRHAQEQEIPGPSRVDGFEQTVVDGEDLVVQRGCGVQPPAVADVVDADPKGEEGVGVFPGGGGGALAVDGDVLVLDLVLEAEDCGGVGGDEGAVYGGAAVGHVVGFYLGGVVGCGEEADPVGAVGGSPAGPWGVAEGVGGAWLGALGVKASLRVGIAAAGGVSI